MTNPAKAIIFDLGNVLYHWEPYRVYKDFFPNRQAIDAFLKEINFPAWNAEQDKGRPFADGVAILSTQFPHYSHLIKAYDERWEDSNAGSIDGTVKLAYKVKQAGYPLYLLSNFSCEKFPLIQKCYDFLEIFDDIIISGEHNLVKPDPAIYRLTLKRINRTASECVFIDDSLANIETADELGFRTIRFVSPADLETALHSMNIL